MTDSTSNQLPDSSQNLTLFNEAVKDSSKVRTQALENAKIALEEAFKPKLDQMLKVREEEERKSQGSNIIKQKISEGKVLTSDDLDGLVHEFERETNSNERRTISPVQPKTPMNPENNVPPHLSTNPAKRKAFEETKKLMENFREKTANYPKYISYEGSMVLCVMLSMRDEASPHITNLPMVDQQTIRALIPDHVSKDLDYFSVYFDDEKDFVVKISYRTGKNVGDMETITLNMFNAVAHPRPEDLKDIGMGAVPVEKDGDQIAIGGKRFFNKEKIQRLAGIDPKPSIRTVESDEDLTPKRQPVAGRNAYEIRADVLQMAIDWSRGETVASHYTHPDDIIKLAKQFYTFVENKR